VKKRKVREAQISEIGKRAECKLNTEESERNGEISNTHAWWKLSMENAGMGERQRKSRSRSGNGESIMQREREGERKVCLFVCLFICGI